MLLVVQGPEEAVSTRPGKNLSHLLGVGEGFPDGDSGEGPTCQCRRCEFHPLPASPGGGVGTYSVVLTAEPSVNHLHLPEH